MAKTLHYNILFEVIIWEVKSKAKESMFWGIGAHDINAAVPGWEWKQLKGCVFWPPFLLPVPGGPKEARKRNPSIAYIPVCLLEFEV